MHESTSETHAVTFVHRDTVVTRGCHGAIRNGTLLQHGCTGAFAGWIRLSEPDKAEALNWYLKAAEKGIHSAEEVIKRLESSEE